MVDNERRLTAWHNNPPHTHKTLLVWTRYQAWLFRFCMLDTSHHQGGGYERRRVARPSLLPVSSNESKRANERFFRFCVETKFRRLFACIDDALPSSSGACRGSPRPQLDCCSPCPQWPGREACVSVEPQASRLHYRWAQVPGRMRICSAATKAGHGDTCKRGCACGAAARAARAAPAGVEGLLRILTSSQT